MKKLDWYVLKELMVPFLIGTIAVLLMFQANQFIYLFKNVSLQNVPFSAFAQLVLYKTPFWASITLPVGMSLASSLAVSRLTRESELTAMRAVGARILRVIMPIALFGLAVAIGDFYLVERVMPPAERRFGKLSNEVGVLGGIPTFNQNIGIKLKNWYVNFGAVQRGSTGNLVLTDIILFDRSQGNVTVITSAKRGTYMGGNWTLTDTFTWVIDGQNLLSGKPGKPVVINEPIEIDSIFTNPVAEEKSLEELKETIERNKRSGLNTRNEEVQFHNRFALPVSCLVFALIGPVFAVWFARSGAFMGVLLSIILVIVYYNAWVISTEILGKNGWTPPWLAAWLPNIIFILLGLVAIRRLE
ncbi:MAG TPA: LptF/LptG family permease [Fimbriimonadaceae bacterium]|nr:LptF/LptG family permease [Fimbriimonadaceae bacterium]